MRFLRTLPLFVLICLAVAGHAQDKRAITLDEFMNATDIREARISPDGSAAVIATTAPDWKQNRFKDELLLWTRSSGAVIALTHSRHDSSPAWSPDGQYIAFLSDRPLAGAEDDDDDKDKDDKDADETSRVWLIPVHGGEAFPLFRDKLDVHAFAWLPDGSSIIFSATEAVAKSVEEVRKTEWKDVVRWREQEHGDVLLALPIASAIRESAETPEPHKEMKTPEDKPAYPVGSRVVTHSVFGIDTIVPSPSGDRIAFETEPVSHRLENPADSELFVVATEGGDAKQLTHNEGLESHLAWEPSGKSIDFLVSASAGSIEGPYQDAQGRVYRLDVASGKVTRLGGDFQGSWGDLAVTRDGRILAAGQKGVEQHIYRIDGSKFESVATVPGNYDHLHVSLRSDAVLFLHSSINAPTQVYVADASTALNDAKAVTALNPVFGERAQVTWRPYQWKSNDGTAVEGVLIYPPGKDGAKNLRMLTLIHGGPADADGNHFGADWYDWATLAAANGWLVFRPNYRGSSGYGDAFLQGIMPHLVSTPGVDILAGVDALVKDGIADANHLAIGGYSYGGYMTNWLITQTTRFKSAVTGAGAVEHAANWGNDDLTWDDAWYLSGTPWEKPELYQSEAALFRMDKVTTPTHIVGGDADDRVSYFEQVLLERSLERLNVPHALLVFPGENHPLDKNPWHGYIKVREELKWLAKYDAK
jgi:dipeptidyl aminopeptidase/acylaminoacyl peptidase